MDIIESLNRFCRFSRAFWYTDKGGQLIDSLMSDELAQRGYASTKSLTSRLPSWKLCKRSVLPAWKETNVSSPCCLAWSIALCACPRFKFRALTSNKSVPSRKSVMMSLPSPPSRLLTPVPPSITSLPLPPKMRSSPLPPSRVSSPAWPRMRSRSSLSVQSGCAY